MANSYKDTMNLPHTDFAMRANLPENEPKRLAKWEAERIYERVWGWEGEGSSSVVAEHIKRIRAKLMQAGAQGQIETVWGVGYKWVK